MTFDKIQEKFEEAHRQWAFQGKLIDYWRFVFWEWRYRSQKLPQK